jgi:hypothetical protein
LAVQQRPWSASQKKNRTFGEAREFQMRLALNGAAAPMNIASYADAAE